jgi:putative hemolysin
MKPHDIPVRLLKPAPRLPRLPRTEQTLPLHVSWARSEDEVREAQALRFQVFAKEMGARLGPSAAAGLDADVFDPFCEHLLVRAGGSADEPGPVVGTYRVLTPAAAKRAGGFYSETEFDLTRLRGLRTRMVEVGRSCVHAEHRSGGAILALWGALTEFMGRNRLDTMIGCASVGMRDGGHVAASLYRQLALQHLAPIDCRVRPRLPLPIDALRQDLQVEPPALIRGYLRCGAQVMGEPAWDPDFQVADLPLLLRTANLPTRFKRLFEQA